MPTKRKSLLFLMLCLVIPPAVAQQRSGRFEYQGLRIGMTRAQVKSVLEKYHKPSAIRWDAILPGNVSAFDGKYSGNPQVNLTLDEQTGKLINITFADEVHDFDTVSFPFLQHYGRPNKNNSDTEHEWEVKVPSGCSPSHRPSNKTPCQHYENLHVYLYQGETFMVLSGEIK